MNTLINTFKNKNRPPFLMIWGGWMLCALMDILGGLVRIFTLCFVMPDWTFKVIVWITKLQIKWKQLNKF